MHELDVAVKGLERQLGEALVPTLTKAAKAARGHVEEIDKMGKPIGDLLSHFGGIDAAFKALTNPAGLAESTTSRNSAAPHLTSSRLVTATATSSCRLDALYHKQDDASRSSTTQRSKPSEAALGDGDAHLAMDAATAAAAPYIESNPRLRQALGRRTYSHREGNEGHPRLLRCDINRDGRRHQSRSGIASCDPGIRRDDKVGESLFSRPRRFDHDKNLKALQDTNAYQGSPLQMAQADATLAESKAGVLPGRLMSPR